MATELSRRIGRRIRERRKELELTQKELAARFDSDAIDSQRISDWERGANQPSARYHDPLIAALELPDIGRLYEPFENEPTADLMGALDPDAQLNRIEQKLDVLIAAIRLAADARPSPLGASARRLRVLVQSLPDQSPPETGKGRGAVGGSGK